MISDTPVWYKDREAGRKPSITKEIFTLRYSEASTPCCNKYQCIAGRAFPSAHNIGEELIEPTDCKDVLADICVAVTKTDVMIGCDACVNMGTIDRTDAV